MIKEMSSLLALSCRRYHGTPWRSVSRAAHFLLSVIGIFQRGVDDWKTTSRSPSRASAIDL